MIRWVPGCAGLWVPRGVPVVFLGIFGEFIGIYLRGFCVFLVVGSGSESLVGGPASRPGLPRWGLGPPGEAIWRVPVAAPARIQK